MEVIIDFIAKILAPLSIGITMAAILAGLFLGSFYNYRLNIPPYIIFHKAVAGWSFITFIFMFRLFDSIQEGTTPPTFFGWIGIGLLWGIYCGSIFIGERAAKAIFKKKRVR